MTAFDMSVVQEAKDAMKAKFPVMVSYFIEDSQSYVNEIRSAITADNYSQATVPAHTLKSSSRQMGAIKLSGIAKQFEELARNADGSSMKKLLPQLEEAFLEAVEGIKKL